MTQVYLEQADNPDPPSLEWEEILVSACDTLVRVPPKLISCISVTRRFRGIEGEARCLVAMSRRLAIQYGLREIVQVEGLSCTVSFSRQDGEPHR